MVRFFKCNPVVLSLAWILILAFIASSTSGQMFTLPNGVASGDVMQTSAVLWAHSTAQGEMKFEYSTFDDFRIINGHETVTVLDVNQPMKMEIRGLIPATQYYYRVTDAKNETAVGQFRTPYDVGISAGLRFGASGDWQQAPPFPSLMNVPERDLDFFIKLGDSIYADSETPALPGIVQARTLDDFRIKHSENLSFRFGLNVMALLNASTPILVTIDDHEIVDNFAGGAVPGQSPDAPNVHPLEPPLFTEAVDFVNETQVYQDAMQAFQAYHPIRNELWDTPNDVLTHGKPKFYRKIAYGSDAIVLVLDARSFRDAPLPVVIDPFDANEVEAFLISTFNSNRTMLGSAQLECLKNDLLNSHKDSITWKFVIIPEPIQNFGIINAEDRFEGYAAERTDLLRFIHENHIENVVFVAGDFHGTIVNNLAYQELMTEGTEDAEIVESTPISAFEIVTGPVAFFDGLLGPSTVNLAASAGVLNPFVKSLYDRLPVAPDMDSIANDKDDFLKSLINTQLEVLDYDPIGLNENNSNAEGLIDSELLQGDYLACHTFGWAEFEITPETQELLVTVYGIDAYSEADLQADPDGVISRVPRVVSQFVVHPNHTTPGNSGNDTNIGLD
jgi:phosphodiesterase/alkaline phosphatase D-like protein